MKAGDDARAENSADTASRIMIISLHRALAALAFLPLAIAAQQPAGQPAQPSAEELQRANTAFTQSDWRAVYDQYSALAQRFPTHALSHFRMGVALVGLGRPAEAESHLREGERLGIPAPQAGFRLGEALAEQGKADAAIAELQRSASAGALLGPTAIETDPHFASLHSHPKWKTVVDAFGAAVFPCRYDPHFREFDFWIGDWDVRATGAPEVGPAARNTVTLELNDCVVEEHWTAPNGSQGTSYNLYDRSHAMWRQTWVDNLGGQHDYHGYLKDGNMVFEGDTPAPNGQLGRIPTRLTFFHIGRDSVRQYSQTSPDSGKTWQPNYDLMYVRRKSP